jgi:predicted lipid-binding transport protein (Tim44 family)
MTFPRRMRAWVKIFIVTLALALPLAMTVISSADARGGGGRSMGSRGMRTYSAPPTTPTAPNAASPVQRSITQPGATAGAASAGAAAKGGMFNRPGLLGGLAAGFLGAGLFGMLFGSGLFSGLGGLSSILGLVLQLGLIYLVVRLAMNWWRRRNAPAYANAMPDTGAQQQAQAAQMNARSGFGFGFGANTPPLQITPADYDTFERRLSEIQTAWSNGDVEKLHTLATPEMVSYFSEDLAENKARGVVNKVSDVKLLQGDLAEAWREGPTDYATLGLRFRLVDKTLDRASGRLVEGSETPEEVTEVWTFARRPGTDWELSAIQQA